MRPKKKYSLLTNVRQKDMLEHKEEEAQIRLVEGNPYVLRLDGHHFSKFTACFKKPNDPRSMLKIIIASV